MMLPFKLKIITPERVVYEDEITEVTLPTTTGEITILADHEPLVTLLKPGELVIRKERELIHLAVSTGLVEMRTANELLILADTAEHAEELELEKIKEAQARAEELLKNKHNMEDVEFAQAQAALERELARIKVATRRRHRN